MLSRHRPFRTHAIDRGLCASFASYWYLHPHPRRSADPASQEPRCPQLTRVRKNHPRGLTRVQKHHPRGLQQREASQVSRCPQLTRVQKNRPRGLARTQKHHPRGLQQQTAPPAVWMGAPSVVAARPSISPCLSTRSAGISPTARRAFPSGAGGLPLLLHLSKGALGQGFFISRARPSLT